jgi:hypothetical protein
VNGYRVEVEDVGKIAGVPVARAESGIRFVEPLPGPERLRLRSWLIA